MVSSLLFVTTLVFQLPGVPANGFRPNTPAGKQSAAPQAEAPKKITAEMRGDIFMARKMYREAHRDLQERAPPIPRCSPTRSASRITRCWILDAPQKL